MPDDKCHPATNASVPDIGGGDDLRHNWMASEALGLFSLPFNDLIFRAQSAHRDNFDANTVQLSSLLSVKTGGCPEDCAYCPQSALHEGSIGASKLMDVDEVLTEATHAKESGATRFCMGAAWRNPKDKDLDKVCNMIAGVRALGLETCATLGMLTKEQAKRLKTAGLEYYNHNIDTSEEFYGEIITTRSFQDRLDTLNAVRGADIKVCCGGIVGMGESRSDRAGMLTTLANLPKHPESVPINLLVRSHGTPLAGADDFDSIEFVRTIAIAKIMMPASVIRLSAGREKMSEELQTLCFLAGAGSIFVGPKLLTTPNPPPDKDHTLFKRLGIAGADVGAGRLRQ